MTFFKHISNYIVVFIIFGLWSTWRNIQYKWLFRIYSIAIIIGIFCTHLPALFTDKIFGTSSLPLTISTISFGTIVLTHLIIAIETPFKRNAQLKLIEKFTQVDQTFNNGLSEVMPHKEQMQKLFFHTILYISIVLFITALIWVSSYYFQEIYDQMYFWTISSCIMRLRLIEILFFVYLVRSRLILINIELEGIQKSCEVSNYVMKNVLDLSVFEKQMIYPRLIHIKTIYGDLYEICQLINTIFGWSLLALVTQSFADFIANGYWLFLLFDGNPYITISTLIMCICLIALDTCALGPLTYFCSSCLHHVSVSMCWILKAIIKWMIFSGAFGWEKSAQNWIGSGQCHWE